MYQLERNAIVSFGILLIDFIESEENASMENTFRELCESKEPKTFGSVLLGGGGGWSITNHGRFTKIPIPSEFEFVELISLQEFPSVTDVYCYGILKRESIEQVESDHQEFRKLIDRTQYELEKFIEPQINGIFSRDELGEGYGLLPVRILHLNPEITNPFRVKTIGHKWIYDEESVNQWMTKNSPFLNIFGFNTDALMSKENLSLISTIPVWGDYRAGFVLVSFHGLSHEKYCPIHQILPSDMLKMLRIYYWSQFRCKQINPEKKTMETFYQRLRDAKEGKSISQLLERLGEVDKIYSDVLQWQANLLTILTQVREETEHFKVHLYNLNVVYDCEKCLDAAKTDSETDTILSGEESVFKWTLFPSIYGSTKASVNYLNNNSSRVDEGQRTLVRYIHDFVNTLFAVGNVNLQKEIRNLTKASLIVALIALLIALAAFL